MFKKNWFSLRGKKKKKDAEKPAKEMNDKFKSSQKSRYKFTKGKMTW